MNSAHLVLIAVLIVVACEEDRKPPVPTTPTPNTTILFPGPSLSRLNIQGPAPTVGPRQTAAGEGRRSLLGRIRTRCDGRCKMDIHAAGDRDGGWRRDHGTGARTDADSGNVHVPQCLSGYGDQTGGHIHFAGDDYRAGTGQRWNGDSGSAEWPVAAASDGGQLWVL